MIDKDRLNHSYGVANKMVETGKKIGLKDEELQDLFVLGFNHDIGYEYTENGKGQIWRRIYCISKVYKYGKIFKS